MGTSTARGRPGLEARVTDIISHEANKDRKRPRKDVQVAIVKALKEAGLPVPKLSTLMSKISEARKAPIGELGAPWSMGATATYPLPADALKTVLQISIGKHRKEGDFEIWETFSIREALWIGRLLPLFPRDIERLRAFAIYYSVREAAYEAAGQKVCDTADLDLELAKAIEVSPPMREELER